MTLPAAPATPRRPVRVDVSGVVFTDPYTWLEEDRDPEVVQWQKAQNSVTDTFLAESCDVEGVGAAIVRHIAPPPTVPVRRGDRTYFLRPDGDASRPVLVVNDSGDEHVVVDPNLAGGRTLDWWHVSPTGRWVLYGLSVGGDEQSVLHAHDVDARQTLPVNIPFCSALAPAWTPDESGIWFNKGLQRDQEDSQKYLFHWRFGDHAPIDPEPTPFDLPIHAVPIMSPDGRWLGVLTYPAVHTFRLAWIRDVKDPSGQWRRFVEDGDELCLGFFHGDRYIAVSKDEAPRGRVVSIPVATSADVSTWKELVPQTEAVLESIVPVGDRIVLNALSEARSRLTVHTFDGELVDEVKLPETGVVSALALDPDPIDPTGIRFLFGSVTTSDALFRYAIATAELEALTTPMAKLEGVTTRRILAPSRDGTLIPALLVHLDDLDLDTPHPAIIRAYGGFNHRFLPSYDPAGAMIVEAGGIYVHANLRGGGEFGSDWWRAGRMARKQNTFDDLFGVAEYLIREGVTTADQLGMIGGSNGGLTASAAAVQRPDLFRAIVPSIPIVDLLRVTRDPFPYSAVALDYGDPNVPHMAAWLYDYSPIHHIEDGNEYTAMLVHCGNDDYRCPPWHSRKLAGALQNATVSSRPILLRVMDDIGHGTGKTAANALAWAAEPYAFLMNAVGLTAAPAPAGAAT